MEMLIAVILVFYHFRIPILLFPDIASTMSRIPISGDLINSKILELCYHYLALSIAIILLNPKIGKIKHHFDRRKANKLLLLASVIIFFDIFSAEFLSEGYGGRAAFMGTFRIIPSIFTPATTVFILVVFLVVAKKNLTLHYKHWAMALIVIYAVYACYSGKKAPVLYLILNFLIAKMICDGPIIVKIRNAVAAIILVPLAIVSYFIGNTMRSYQRGIIDADIIIEKISMIKGSLGDMITAVSFRMGFFDFYVESSETAIYLPYISYRYYFKSIVDKLTPGFDVFGEVFASRMFWYARQGSFPEKGMHSDQVTLFGEASVIFSFFSIIMFFVMIMFFGFLIKRRPAADPFLNIFYVAIIFLAYCRWLCGYGFDMFICVEFLYNIIFFFCMAWFCRFSLHSRKKKIATEIQ